MKPNRKCKLYKFLFRVLPIPAWQVYVMDNHFSQCPHCREEVTTDERLKELFVSRTDAQRLPEVWPYVNKHMEEPAETPTREPVPRWKIGWQWKTAAVGLVLVLVIVFLPFSFEKKSTVETHQGDREAGGQVIVKSVKIGSQAAKFYFFESKDPDKLIVWAQRNQNNGG